MLFRHENERKLCNGDARQTKGPIIAIPNVQTEDNKREAGTKSTLFARDGHGYMKDLELHDQK